jgi:hypothetical protein
MEVGRPTKYKEEYNYQAYKLCLLGVTDKELSEFFNISESTLNLWKQEHLEFSESVNRGKLIADAEVAESFHKRAIGYTYEEETYEKGVHTKTVVKEVAPDPGAALNWLKNRQPNKWRDKHEVDHTTQGEKINIPPIIWANGNTSGQD